MFIIRPNQHKYLTNLISMVGLQSGNLVNTPLEVNVKYHCDDDDLYEVFCQT